MDGGPGGLSSAEASSRLARDGPNDLPHAEHRNAWRIVAGVVREPMLLLLAAAAVIYLLLGDPREAAVLGASVVLVIGLTVVQEYRSERALQALRDLSSPTARVHRDGRRVILPASQLVMGDLVALCEGDRIPADARVVEGAGLRVDESLLSGESAPVSRGPGDGTQGMVCAGTLVVGGNALVEVIATGVRTRMGQIGASLRTLRSPPTPMQREIRRAVWVFSLLGLGASGLLALLFVALRGDWMQGLLAGITLAMANIPEEFPVVLTIFLALGAWRMARRNALIRRMPAIEALGATTVLCTDKTGTLTCNRMAVAEIRSGSDDAEVEGTSLSAGSLALIQHAARACKPGTSDPMEQALLVASGHHPQDPAWKDAHLVREYPFRTDVPMVAIAWRLPGENGCRIACKGAPEIIAARCGLSGDAIAGMHRHVGEMASRGLRVLGVASTRRDDANDLPARSEDLACEWLGLVGLADPLRPGVMDAVATARRAGVRVVMLTGDHVATARAIARQAGFARPDGAMDGSEMVRLPRGAIARIATDIDVFARVQPAHKLLFVEALKARGDVVAMTGDGVNDAPALVAAHVGIAMGQRGTDVAREAAAMVLLDDDFTTIVDAIRQGRRIHDNIVRAVRYIVAVHVPITGLALLPLLGGGPLVLYPLHVVFLELIIDPASTLVFEQEPVAADAMERPPRPREHPLLDAATLGSSLAKGAVVFLAVAGVYLSGVALHLPAPQVGALAFHALVVGNLGLLAINRVSIRGLRGGAHPVFWTIVAGALALLLATTRWPTASALFHFAPPPASLSLLAALAPLVLLAMAEALPRLRGPAV